MKKLFAVLALVGAITYVGASVAHAAVVTRSTFHSDFTFFNACTGEQVRIVGDVDSLTTSTVNDNVISGTFHSVFKATGTGLTSGVQYQEVVVFNRAFETSLQNGEATLTQVGAIHVIAPGGGNDLLNPIFFHTTMDANGNVTSLRIDSPGPTCQ
jgi:hypothetical protein